MKTFKLILATALIFISIQSFAQTDFTLRQDYAQSDTIYFDEKWKTTSRADAHFYRLVEKNEELYHVEDYFMNGRIQMSGVYSSLDPERKEGYFKFYRKNGTVSMEGLYINHSKKWGVERL